MLLLFMDITCSGSFPASGGPPLGGRDGEREARMLWLLILVGTLPVQGKVDWIRTFYRADLRSKYTCTSQNPLET